MEHLIFASYGNDSIALIQWAHERRLEDVHVAYSDTGWAAWWWDTRVQMAEEWARSLGFRTHRIASEGMEALVARKKAWPRGGGGKFQFCTEALKKEPARAWLALHDPNGETTCMTGVRRECWSAVAQSAFKEFIGPLRLFCTYGGERYRCTGASRLGDVWIARDHNRDTGYDLRVDVQDCGQWGREP